MYNKYDIISVKEYFPSMSSPAASPWVLSQTEHIMEFNIKPLVISPTLRLPKILKPFYLHKHYHNTTPNNNIDSYLGIDVIRPPYLKLPSKYFFHYNMYNLSRVITKSGKRFKAKLIHAHFGHAGVASMNLQNKLSIPLVTSFYGFDLGLDKNSLRKYYTSLSQKGDLFLSLSENMANDLFEMGFDKNKVVIHHLGVDVDKFKPLPNNKIREGFVFLVVGSFVKKKGIDYTIKAYLRFKSKNKIKNCFLRIVGYGIEKESLLKLSNGHDDIIFVNNFDYENPRSVVLEEMKNCDVFVLTSIEDKDKEGTPIVLMEAQSCGKPCISTFHAGIPEVVINNHSGILTEERNVDDISEAMSTLYFDKSKREEFGINARNHIIKEFNSITQSKRLFDLYNKLMS